jgi:PAS domain S-box-containing protein
MKTSLEWKITLGFGVSVAMILVLGIVSHKSVNQFIASAEWNDHTRQVLGTIAEIDDAITDVETTSRGYVISGDADYVRDWQAAVARVDPAVREVRSLTSDNPHQQQRLDRVETLLKAKLAVIRQTVEIRRDNGFEAAQRVVQAGESRKTMAEVQKAIGEMKDEERRLLTERAAEERASAQRTIAIITSGSAFGFVIVSLAGWMIRRDIVARRRTAEALRVAEERFRLLIDSVRDYAIFMLDVDGKVASWNGGAQRINGYSSEEVIGRHFSCFYTPEDLQNGKPARELKIATEQGRYEEEGWRICKDGTRLWANVVISPVRDQSGTLRGFAKVTRDVTERKRAQDNILNLNKSLEQHSAQLEAANKELEAFCYSVSHDLRAPLRSIDGFSQALLEDYGDKLDDSGKDSLNRVRAATQRMGQLIDDMLNLSRVTRSDMRLERVDLSAMAAAVVAELRKNQESRSVAVIIQDGLTAYGDLRLLRVVLDNLIGNAWKFTSKRDDARIEFGVRADGGFFVRDNGAGFDMAYSQKLFGAFQRLHAMNEFAGTGIGLATVQRIIHRHGGRVRAEGEVEKGAMFSFTLGSGAAMVTLAA